MAHAPDWPTGSWLAKRRRPVQIFFDAVAWVFSLLTADVLRYDLNTQHLHFGHLAFFCIIAIGGQAIIGHFSHLYRIRYQYGSFEEVRGVFFSAGVVGATLSVVDLTYGSPRLVPASVPISGTGFAIGAMFGIRYSWRLYIERRQRHLTTATHRVLVFGAGAAGSQAISVMLGDPNSGLLPVGLLDDDPRKSNLRIKGIRVLGSSNDVGSAASVTRADVLLIAIPAASQHLIRSVAKEAELAGLKVKLLPPVSDLMFGKVGIEDFHDLDLASLLGRRQVDLDLTSIAGYLKGKRVLVTGAGGSIGSEICRQLVKNAPAELIMLDRDESSLHAVQLDCNNSALFDTDQAVLADIRDADHIHTIFAKRRPEIVFHAAALKHLSLLEQYPDEAMKTNVQGTSNVLEASIANGVTHFINISTDKAANPICNLGYSKRIAERLTSEAGERTGLSYVSVRFGNVLGSRGSMLPTFAHQIASGGPLTVTHPDVTRFFMTVQEAVSLVIQGGAIGASGAVLILDMGERVRILDVARRLIRESGKDIEIVYTGLRTGEKLHEDLFAIGEKDHRPNHPMISEIAAPLVDSQIVEIDLRTPQRECQNFLTFFGSDSDLQVFQGKTASSD